MFSPRLKCGGSKRWARENSKGWHPQAKRPSCHDLQYSSFCQTQSNLDDSHSSPGQSPRFQGSLPLGKPDWIPGEGDSGASLGSGAIAPSSRPPRVSSPTRNLTEHENWPCLPRIQTCVDGSLPPALLLFTHFFPPGPLELHLQTRSLVYLRRACLTSTHTRERFQQQCGSAQASVPNSGLPRTAHQIGTLSSYCDVHLTEEYILINKVLPSLGGNSSVTDRSIKLCNAANTKCF